MTREAIVALFARRELSWSQHDAAALAADHAVDGVVISPTGGVLEGRAEIERVYRVWFTAFPDLSFATEMLVIDGHHAALLCRVGGTHSGEFFGTPPSGRRIDVFGALFYDLGEGSITHERRVLDFTGLLVQVGVLRAKPAGGYSLS
jgi:predicted ester cyclase